jgi:RNA polymerase sigma factor (sigma-70 family)
MTDPTVFLVDDDPAVRKAIERLLRSAGFAIRAFESAEAFLAAHEPDHPGCALLDIAMSGLSGIEVQRLLNEGGQARPVIFLTGHGDVPTSVGAMKSGAVDFLTKPVDESALLQAIERALAADRRQRAERQEREVIERRLATLTGREREVMRHVVAGLLNKQVAARLGVAEKTVKVHRARLMEKMGADSLAALVRMTERAGIAPADAKRRG